MVNTGKNFEEIVSLLKQFQNEVKSFASLGLTNINKHSENFFKRILNLVYDLELIDLNNSVSNYPGIDLGDKDAGIAYQITSTKSSEKVNHTLQQVLKHNHYMVFPTIRILILTSKQSTYTISALTEPYFIFDAKNQIIDIDDLLKDIQPLNHIKIGRLLDYIRAELTPTLEKIEKGVNKDDKNQAIVDVIQVQEDLAQCRMSTYAKWQSSVQLTTEQMSVPVMFDRLNHLLPSGDLMRQLYYIFNSAFASTRSNSKVVFDTKLQNRGAVNDFGREVLILENSKLIFEQAHVSDHEHLLNLRMEMITLLLHILFFVKNARRPFEILINIELNGNSKTYLSSTNSLVLRHISNTFVLDGPFKFSTTLTDCSDTTLLSLLQAILYGFTAVGTTSNPFISVDEDFTLTAIRYLKRELNINEGIN